MPHHSQVHEPSQVFAILVVAAAFLWIAIAGSGRVLKVLDRRNYFLFGGASRYGGGAAGAGGTRMHGGGTPASTFRGSLSPRHSTAGGGSASGGGMYGGTLTDSLWSDNRFIFGSCAVAIGILRACYLILLTFLQTGSADIGGDNMLADSVTAPLAWLFFSLLSSILWALRELIERVSISFNLSGPNSTLSSPQLTPQRLGNIAGSGGSSQVDPESQTAATNTSSNNDNNSGGQTLCEKMAAPLRPFRAVTTSVAIFIVIGVSIAAAYGQRQQGVSDGDASLIPAVASSVIAFVLFVWSVTELVDSLRVMQAVGFAAHRVTLAVVAMAVFLLVRGILILPPIQGHLCSSSSSSSSSFWRCTFVYDFLDCAGVGLVLALLP